MELQTTLLRALGRLVTPTKTTAYYHDDDPLEYFKPLLEEAKEEPRDPYWYRRSRGDQNRKIAPENMHQKLMEKATKNRSPSERENALSLLPDEMVAEQVRNKKQHKRVREYGLNLLSHDKDLVDEMARNGDYQKLKHQAIEMTENPEILLDVYNSSGNPDFLFKLDEDTIMDNLPENLTFRVDHRNITKPENAKKLLETILNSRSDYRDVTLLNKVPAKDLKALYPKMENKEAQAYTILQNQKDKAFLKKAFETAEGGVENLVLQLLDDQALYKKAAQKPRKYGNPDFAMRNIEDTKFLMKLIDDSNMSRVPSDVLNRIEDQKFLKDYYERTEDTSALENIQDADYVKELYAKEPSREVLKHIKDEAFLKDIFEKYAHVKSDNKRTNDQRADYRSAALHNIKDQDFISKTAQEDPHFEVRTSALRYLEDVDLLEKILLKEKSKTALQSMIENVESQEVLKKLVQKRKGDTDSDIRNKIYDKLTPVSIEELFAEGIDPLPPRQYAEKIDKEVLKDLIRDDVKIASKYFTIFEDDQPFLTEVMQKHETLMPRIADYITDEKLLGELLQNPEVLKEFDSFDQISDPEILKHILLNKPNLSYDTSDLLTELNPEPEFIEKLVKEANSDYVRKEASNFISDESHLFDMMLDKDTSPDLAYDYFKKIWKDIKEDPDKVAEIVDKTSNDKIIRGMTSKLKGRDDLLKKAMTKVSEDLKVRLIGLMKDKNEIYKAIPSIPSGRLRELKNDHLVLESLLQNEDLDKPGQTEKINRMFQYLDKKLDPETLSSLFEAKSKMVRALSYPFLKANENQVDQDIVKYALESGDLHDNDSAKVLNYTDDNDLIIRTIPNLRSHHWNEIDPKYVYKALIEAPDVNIEQASELRNHLLDEDKKVPSKALYEKAKSEGAKQIALVHYPAKDMTPELVGEFLEAFKIYDSPYAVDKKLLTKAYKIGTDEQQDTLQGFIKRKDLVERHRDTLDRPYLSPKKDLGGFEKLSDPTVKSPINQVYRLLVQLAR